MCHVRECVMRVYDFFFFKYSGQVGSGHIRLNADPNLILRAEFDLFTLKYGPKLKKHLG